MKLPQALFCRAVALTGLPEFITAQGGDPHALYKTAGLNLSELGDLRGFVDWNKVCNLLELCAKVLNEPLFGAKWGQSLDDSFVNSGPLYFLVPILKTGKDFADLALKYQKLHTNGVSYGYRFDTASNHYIGTMNFNALSQPCPQYCEHILTVIIQIVKRHHEGPSPFKSISVQHSPPRKTNGESSETLEQILGCPITYNSLNIEIEFDSRLFEYKIDGRLSFFKTMLTLYLDTRFKKELGPDSSIGASIAEILPDIFGLGRSDMGSVANALQLSQKKLQRLLRDEGLTFSDIVDETRQHLARRYLQQTDLQIIHIAKLLDYKSGEAFNAACQRWFGCSPVDFRAENLDS